MRLFVALPLPRSLERELAQLMSGPSGELGSPRWVRPEGLHLTLAFIGEVDEAKVPSLCFQLESAAKPVAPFALEVDGLGAFPERGRVKVLWAGVGASGRESLVELRRRTVEGIERVVAFSDAARPFHPHITLGRCSPPRSRSSFESWRDRVRLSPATIAADEIRLISSAFGRGAERYRTVAAFPLRRK